MSSIPPASSNAPRRVVLIDFDWEDADLLPELVRRPELSVRLVAGQHAGDPGLRVAELCGLPGTADLGDLTRELFDLALVGERSTRRTQIEGLLQVLGTPCLTPQSFLGGESSEAAAAPAVEAEPVLHAAALETSLGGSYDAMLAQAIPDASAPADGVPAVRPAPAEAAEANFDSFPSPEDRQGLEAALDQMLASTGATAAEVHAGRVAPVGRVARVGDEDPLLTELVGLALRLDAPQVVSRLNGPLSGRAWGAWPFHTATHHGVIAAGGIHPAEGWTAWEQMVDEVRTRWDQRDRAQAAPAFPIVPGVQTGWLEARDFRIRLELAVARNARDGFRFALHRIAFGDDPALFEGVCAALPALLRDSDSLCRRTPPALLLLTPAAPRGWDAVRARLLEILHQTWRSLERPGDPPALTDDHLELADPAAAAGFLDAANGWLSA